MGTGGALGTDADVAVIGGGIAGVSVAAELADTHTVVLLEQEDQLAHHTTGRSAAAFLESYGGPEIRALTRASRPLFDTDSGEAPLLTPRPLVWVAGPDAGAATAIAAMREQQPRLAVLGPDEARSLCPELRPEWITTALVEHDAQDIDVAGLHQSYVRRARQAGATILTGAGQLAAARTADDRRWRLTLSDGRTVAAEVVVNAAGAWADQVAALFGARPVGLQPLRRTIAIARVPDRLSDKAPLVADIGDGFYYRPEGPHVLVSPADETPSEPCDARPDEADVALALDRVGEATTLGLRSVVTAWAGLRTFAPDRVPVAGSDPDIAGLFWLAGQGGYGIQTAPALARLAAALVRNQQIEPPAATVVPGLDPTALSPVRFRAGRRPLGPGLSGGSGAGLRPARWISRW